MKFEELGLIEPILKAIEEMGYVTPSPIQEKAIPPVLAGKDVVGSAQTGTGKTAAFGIPILQKVYEKKDKRAISALILTPTRELALQIEENLKLYGKYTKARVGICFGGVSQTPQVAALKRGVDVLVATPGRLMDLYAQGHMDLSQIEVLVLDEADRMLDMGFVKDIRRILTFLPEKKQTLLFSATMPDEILRLIETFLNDPVEVAVAPVSSTVDTIEQSIYFVDRKNKIRLLLHLLKKEEGQSALVFVRTKRSADRIEQELKRAGVRAAAIHGDKAQNLRQQALNRFKEGKINVLVATDIAARGIDVEELAYVFNYNLPDIPETYVHRIGRTGRAGKEGKAISFCDYDELPYFDAIEQLIQMRIPQIADHPYPMMMMGESQANHKPSERVSKDGELFAKAKESGVLRNNQVVAPKRAPAKKKPERREIAPKSSPRIEKPPITRQKPKTAPVPKKPAAEKVVIVRRTVSKKIEPAKTLPPVPQKTGLVQKIKKLFAKTK